MLVIRKLAACTVAFLMAGPLTSCDRATDIRSTEALPEFIGTATMGEAGEITLELVSHDHGSIAHGFRVYRPGDPGYDDVRQHIGPIRPGETVSVRPWPDPRRRRR